MKNKKNENSPFEFITLYNEKKKKFNNNIDYALEIDDKEELKKHLNYILNNNIWNYFKIINYSYKDEFKIIINSERKQIGYLVLNKDYIKQIEEIYNYMEKNINIRMNANEMKDIKFDKFYSFLLCLYNIKELYNNLKIYYKDKIIIKILIDFILSKKLDDKIKEYFLELIKSNDYKIIINDIFEKINSELSNENIYDKLINQVAQYDENKAKNKFLEKNKNGSIIKKLFLISIEEITYCNECYMSMYNFYNSKFLLIDLDKEEKEILLNEQIFKSENIQIKKKCSFCAEKTTNCIKKDKIFDYPEILIVLLDGKQFKNFKLENNIYILCNNSQDILYYLISFIESDTNIVYIDEKNKWYKYIENNNKEESKDYNKKNPIVLFYKLTDRKFINKIINDNKNDFHFDNKDSNDSKNNNDNKITKNNKTIIKNNSMNFNNLNNRIIIDNNLNSNVNINKNNINYNKINNSINNNMNNNINNNIMNINNNNMINDMNNYIQNNMSNNIINNMNKNNNNNISNNINNNMENNNMINNKMNNNMINNNMVNNMSNNMMNMNNNINSMNAQNNINNNMNYNFNCNKNNYFNNNNFLNFMNNMNYCINMKNNMNNINMNNMNHFNLNNNNNYN